MQCTDRQFAMQRYNASHRAIRCLFLQDDVTAALSDLHESHSLQGANRFGA